MVKNIMFLAVTVHCTLHKISKSTPLQQMIREKRQELTFSE